LRLPAHGIAKIGLAVIVPAGMKAAACGNRLADDISPAQPAPLDEFVRLQAGRRPLAVVRGAQYKALAPVRVAVLRYRPPEAFSGTR
jgi:hypothetical protein